MRSINQHPKNTVPKPLFRNTLAQSLTKLLDTVGNAGIDVSGVLRKHKLDNTDLASQGYFLSRFHYIAVVEDILKIANIPDLGLQMGQQWVTMEAGVFGYAMTSSANLRKSLERHTKYQDVTQPVVHLFEELTPNQVYLRATTPQLSAAAHRYFTEEWMASWTKVALRFQDNTHWFSRVDLSYPQPEYSDRYREVFGCPVYFDQPQDQICFSRHYLDKPYFVADEAIATFCEHQCDVILQELSTQTSLCEQIRHILMRSEGQFPNLNQMAELLQLSPRQLYRKLQEEGSSFQTLLKEVRMKLAEEYLKNTDLPIKKIATLLGYSEIANFHRAFQKWFNATPLVFREKFREGG